MALPEDEVNWRWPQPERCYFYPGRDCPGCVKRCARVLRPVPEGWLGDV